MQNDYWKNYWDTNAGNAESGDVHRQVLRISNKQPISAELFDKLLEDTSDKLQMQKNDCLLDLCCGNGLITSHLAAKCKSAIGVDFSQKLVNEINKRNEAGNIVGIVDDITKVTFKEATFDKILLYAGIQYLSQKQAVVLFSSLYSWLKKGGIIFIGDIPDSNRIWNFFNTGEREDVYFKGILEDTPLIGTWFDRAFLEKLAVHCNFSECKIVDQPKDFIYSHFRFDMLLKK